MSSRWKYSVGSRPNTVTVYERPGRSSIYIRVWDPEKQDGKGGYNKDPLGHTDREKAKAEAAEKHAKLVKGQKVIRQGGPPEQALCALQAPPDPEEG